MRRRRNPRAEHIGGWLVVITIQRSTSIHRLEGKRMKGKTTQKHIKQPSATLHKAKIFTGFRDRLLGEGWKFYYINSKEKKLQEKAKFYATSAAGFVVVEGAEESASALGGSIKALGTGVEELGVGVEEAAEGVIIDTMPGA
jgi:hypothetical protein